MARTAGQRINRKTREVTVQPVCQSLVLSLPCVQSLHSCPNRARSLAQ